MKELSVVNKNIIKLKLIPGIGDKTIQKIINCIPLFQTEELDYGLIKDYLNKKQLELYREFEPKLENETKNIQEQLLKNNINLVNINDNEYPEALKKIYSYPTLLFYKGNIDYDFYKSISIVGTRNFSSYGENQCKRFVEYLGSNYFAIVSGLALGIDAIAHKIALNLKNNTKCIGVVGNGLNFIYPTSNHKLYSDILEKDGCIISQFLPNVEPKPEYFPLRNAIIAGLSRGTLVIEAADKSGSLITANFAFENNREVYALPADLNREKSEGCNLLIKKQIAKLVTKPEDIIEDFGLKPNSHSQSNSVLEIDKRYRLILDLLSFRSLKTDEIAMNLKKEVIEISSLLSEMELDGLVIKDDIGKWIRI